MSSAIPSNSNHLQLPTAVSPTTPIGDCSVSVVALKSINQLESCFGARKNESPQMASQDITVSSQVPSWGIEQDFSATRKTYHHTIQ